MFEFNSEICFGPCWPIGVKHTTCIASHPYKGVSQSPRESKSIYNIITTDDVHGCVYIGYININGSGLGRTMKKGLSNFLNTYLPMGR